VGMAASVCVEQLQRSSKAVCYEPVIADQDKSATWQYGNPRKDSRRIVSSLNSPTGRHPVVLIDDMPFNKGRRGTWANWVSSANAIGRTVVVPRKGIMGRRGDILYRFSVEPNKLNKREGKKTRSR
jgi:hypothetical protein